MYFSLQSQHVWHLRVPQPLLAKITLSYTIPSGTHQASPADSPNFPFPVRKQVLRKPKLRGYKSLLPAISRCSELCLDLFAQAAPKDSSWSSFSFLPVLKAEIIRLSTNTLQNGFNRLWLSCLLFYINTSEKCAKPVVSTWNKWPVQRNH